MKKELIVVSSVTYAMRGKELLERQGFRAYVTRLPRDMENVGCGYSIQVKQGAEQAEQLLRAAGIHVIGRRIVDEDEKHAGGTR